jgi:hypothetical protein
MSLTAWGRRIVGARNSPDSPDRAMGKLGVSLPGKTVGSVTRSSKVHQVADRAIVAP